MGRGKCKLHSGSTPVGKRAAALEGAREALEEVKRRVPFYGNTPDSVPVHPYQVILDNVNRSDRAVKWLEAIIQGWGSHESPAGDSPNRGERFKPDTVEVNTEGGEVLADHEEPWRPKVGDPWSASYSLPDASETGLGVPLMTVSVYGKGGTVHDSEYLAFLRLYQQERDASVRYSKISIDADIAARAEQLNESQALFMRRVIESTLKTLGVEPTEDVAAVVLTEVVKLNRAIEAGTAR